METKIAIANVQFTPASYKRYRLTGVKQKPKVQKVTAIDKQKFLDENGIGWYTYTRIAKKHNTKDIETIKAIYQAEIDERKKAKLLTYQEQIEALKAKSQGLDIKARNHTYINQCNEDNILKEYNAKKDTIIRLITDLDIQSIKLHELKQRYEDKYKLNIF